MLAEIIIIGDEILIGQVRDTNSGWLGQQLNALGIRVQRITTVPDDRSAILQALDESAFRSGIILITGGLGPTRDDITKETLCEYFSASLRTDENVLADVEAFFKMRGKETSPVNRRQAEVPDNCIPLRNIHGTAPAMWFEEKGKIFVSMPGVPYEMMHIMETHVFPRLKEKFKLQDIVHKTILTHGIGESVLSEKIAGWESSLHAEGIKLAYLPSAGMVRLRLSMYNCVRMQAEIFIAEKIEELLQLVPEHIYGFDEDTLEEITGNLLRKNEKTLSVAESCTGGYLSHLITRVPGCSDYFKGSVISYANEIKENFLGVKKEDLQASGAVSREVVEQMAGKVREKFQTDYSIAVSGIAGPGGGTEEKPVGLVWIAVSTPERLVSKKYLFGKDRERNIEVAATTALNMLRKEMLVD